jgi:gamma-glutamylcyclotransferase (GGCT)/AIG2-like uncharacterized protein YtfP
VVHLIFVYGSLKTGASEHWKMDGAKLVGPAETAPHYRLKEFPGFTGLTPGGGESIKGEVYEVDDRKLTELDVWEYQIYRRDVLQLADGRQVFGYLLDYPN